MARAFAAEACHCSRVTEMIQEHAAQTVEATLAHACTKGSLGLQRVLTGDVWRSCILVEMCGVVRA
jgi:hypothetical protein